jgi:hypothetical protein
MESSQVNLAIMHLSESTICCHVIVDRLSFELFNFLHICLISEHRLSPLIQLN